MKTANRKPFTKKSDLISKSLLLRVINKKIEQLDEQDSISFSYWLEFKDIVEKYENKTKF